MGAAPSNSHRKFLGEVCCERDNSVGLTAIHAVRKPFAPITALLQLPPASRFGLGWNGQAQGSLDRGAKSYSDVSG
jgi:hypothetical protein